MLPLETIRERILESVPGAGAEIVANPGPSGQNSLRISREYAPETARFLRDDPGLRFDYCSNVTGVDWPERTVRETITVREVVDGEEKEVRKQVDRVIPGYLEAVYHLYSVAVRHGPLVIRLSTGDRAGDVDLPSLTPVWRSAEFQEREIFDLYGIRFTGHPDLRRLLMWEEFEGHPMRKDYAPPEEDAKIEPAAAENGKESP